MKPDGPLQRINARWQRFATLPLEILIACEGRSRSLRSAVSESTGLSAAHISKNGLRTQHEKRAQRVATHQLKKEREALARKGYSAEEIETLLKNAPDTIFAALVYRFGQTSSAPLEAAQRYARRIDELIEAAAQAAADDAPQTYRECLAGFLEEERCGYTDPDVRRQLDEFRRDVLAADRWDDLTESTDLLIEYALLAFLAAVDVEWGAQYFQRLTPTPTFLWLAPRFHPDFSPDNPMKKEVVSRPVGNLLRLMWAITKRRASSTAEWPTKPPGPTQLAKDIACADIGDGLIRKWSTGAKPISMDQLAEIWTSLCANLFDGETVPVPLPWIMVALWMERALVKRAPSSTKPRGVTFLPDTSYRTIWNRHREQWSAHLPEPGALPWPEWIMAYSSRPDWMRSSQSSGRESSPRDCQ
jgi:hypothetical protein